MIEGYEPRTHAYEHRLRVLASSACRAKVLTKAEVFIEGGSAAEHVVQRPMASMTAS